MFRVGLNAVSREEAEERRERLFEVLSDTDEPETSTWVEKEETSRACVQALLQHAARFQRLDRLERTVQGPVETPTSSGEEASSSDDDASHVAPSSFSLSRRQPWSCDVNMFSVLLDRLLLRRHQHEKYLKSHIFALRPSLFALEASRPWILYWLVHALTLLYPDGFPEGDADLQMLKQRAPIFLGSMLSPTGGFGGGPRQLGHVAPTYAAIAALTDLGAFEYLVQLDRALIFQWLLSLRDPATGGFFVHRGGELDVRGAYCAVAVATFLHLPTETLFAGLDKYIASLQTFDGGLAGAPGLEAHGGYTYCGLAALVLLKRHRVLDLDALLFWTLQRQTSATGGFQGRPNKLHDSCYSFWCAGVLAVLADLGYAPRPSDTTPGGAPAGAPSGAPRGAPRGAPCFYDPIALQMYILGCCQEDQHETVYKYAGGLRDKPGAPKDLYHSCYALSGLSLAQAASRGQEPEGSDGLGGIVGPDNGANALQRIDPLLNVTRTSRDSLHQLMSSRPF